ncbi:MAG: hypothetical protein M1833_003740 [Piccolia ochrophora]|nr:MAG: hypothetical protein M1833_003740 [Piccolia ochrophora]
MPSQGSPKRPSVAARSSSASSLRKLNAGQIPQAASITPPSRSPLHKSHSRSHVVGQSRHSQTRVPSYGKSLNKLTKITHAAETPTSLTTTTTPSTKSRHDATSRTPSTSPRLHQSGRGGSNVSLARNGSEVSLKKNASHVSLKKNSSKTSLHRNGSAVDMMAKKNRRRSRSQQRGAAAAKKDPNNKTAGVHFDLGAEGHEEGWTEISNSDSPELSRVNTATEEVQKPHPAPGSPPHTPPADISPAKRMLPTRMLSNSSAPPQTTTVSATATPSSHSPFSHLRASNNLPLTPSSASKPVVSRFLGASSAASTTTTLAPTPPQQSTSSSSSTPARPVRPASTPHLSSSTSASAGRASPTVPAHSATATATAAAPPPQSRTQQKLNLQRASSALLDPQAHGPHGPLAPRHDGRDPFAAKQNERAALEYGVVRRFRHPVLEGVGRLGELKGLSSGATGGAPTTAAAAKGVGLKRGGSGGSRGFGTGLDGVEDGASGTTTTTGVPGRPNAGGVPLMQRVDEEEVGEFLRRLWERADSGGGE